MLDHHQTYKPVEATVPKFAQFREILEDEVLTIIKKMPVRSCEMAIWEASQMKRAFPRMIRTIIKLVNFSLAEGVSQWKIAILKPLLKKIGLHIMDKSNYRPVSNLTLLSCLVEKCVHIQFNQHCADNTLLPDYHSA